jgi:hypothetical protein
MKKLLLTLFTAIVSLGAYAQCTPDVSITTTGVFPAILDTGNINQPYSQIIQYFITRDTSVTFQGQNINATIDSITITGVKGLPNGLSYSCHNANCAAPGGQAGCVNLSGTPTESGIFPLVVYIRIKARAFLGPLPINQNVNDSNSRLFIAIKPIVSNSIASQQISKDIYAFENNKTLQVWLNQNNNELTNCRLTDLTGKTVLFSTQFTKDNFGGMQANTDGLNKGIYLLQVETKLGFGVKKIFIGQ